MRFIATISLAVLIQSLIVSNSLARSSLVERSVFPILAFSPFYGGTESL
jgi:hypothetical protein